MSVLPKPVLSFTKFKELPKAAKWSVRAQYKPDGYALGGRGENTEVERGAFLAWDWAQATFNVCMLKLLNLSVPWFPDILCCMWDNIKAEVFLRLTS